MARTKEVLQCLFAKHVVLWGPYPSLREQGRWGRDREDEESVANSMSDSHVMECL